MALQNLVFSGLTADSSDEMRAARDFEIFGRHWRLTIAPNPQFIYQLKLLRPRDVAAAGLVLTLLAMFGMTLWARGRDRERAAMEQRTRLAAIIDSANDGILGTDLDGVVTSWNRAAETIFGFSPEEAMGLALTAFIIPPRAFR